MKKTLVPLSQAQMELLVACLAYCEQHPSHRDLEIVDLKERILFFSLKDKCAEPVKVMSEKPKKETGLLANTPSNPPSELLKKLEIASEAKVGTRTENKRNYNKSKLPKPPFGL